MKKILSLVASISILFVACMTPSSADSFDFVEQEGTQNSQTEFLVAAGIPLEFLEMRSADELDTLYDLAQTHTLHYSSCEDEAMTFGTIPDTDMFLYPYFITACSPELPGTRSELDLVLVYVDYAWSAGHPFIHREDAISVNWDSNLFQFVPNQFSSVDYVLLPNNEKISYNSQINPAKLNLGGLGYFADLSYVLPNAVLNHSQYCGSASFAVEPKYTIYAGTGNKTQITIQYVHDKNPSPIGGISFSYNGVGISISSGAFQDSVAKAISIDYSL